MKLKKLKKNLIAFGLILALLCTGLNGFAAAHYNDVSNHWARDAIAWVSNQGLMNGTAPGLFSPNGSAERAMLVTILYRSAGQPAVSGGAPFTDLKQGWSQNAVAWAYKNEVVKGSSPTTFSPADKITRQDIATILYRYVKNILKYDVSASGSLAAFPDAGKVSSYAGEALLWANANGLIKGQLTGTGNYLNPKGEGTRGELATIFRRFGSYQEAHKPTPAPTPEPTPTPPPAIVKVAVPNFLGSTEEQAIASARRVGLLLDIKTDSGALLDPQYPENTVRSQSAAPGTQLERGSTVTLYLNTKPAPVPVPQFIGLTKDEALQLAESTGFQLVFDYRLDPNWGNDVVFKQSVAKDTIMDKGSVLRVTVNSKKDYSQHLTVASYNIKCAWYGKTWNGVLENIRNVDPDIIGLQEVDNGTDRSSSTPGEYRNQIRQLAHDLGYQYWYFAKTINHQNGEYGHGILSKFPIKESKVIKFVNQDSNGDGKDEEIRNMERHVLDVNGTELIFYNCHLNGNFMDQLLELMAAAEADYKAGKPVMITGDFNIHYPDMKGYLDTESFFPLNGTDTFDLGLSKEATQIDNIILSRNITDYYTDETTELCVIPVDLKEEDSDHPMIYSYIKLP